MKFNKHLENLVSYEAGKPIELVVREFGIDEKDVIKLASNENPYGTSPAVVKARTQCVDKMHLYYNWQWKRSSNRVFGAR